MRFSTLIPGKKEAPSSLKLTPEKNRASLIFHEHFLAWKLQFGGCTVRVKGWWCELRCVRVVLSGIWNVRRLQCHGVAEHLQRVRVAVRQLVCPNCTRGTWMHLLVFALICHSFISFAIICHHLPSFAIIRLYPPSLSIVCHNLPPLTSLKRLHALWKTVHWSRNLSSLGWVA